MAFISIESDLSECKKLLNDIGYESKYIQRDLLKSVGQKARTKAKQNYRKKHFSKRTGSLYESINYGLTKDKSTLIISANARSKGSTHVRYGYVLASGHRKVMRKSDNGRWVSTGQEVRFRNVYDIIEEPVRKYLNSPGFKTDLDKALQKKIEKIERKLGIR